MTKRDLLDWVVQNGCRTEPMDNINITGSAIAVMNDTNGGRAFFNTHRMDDKASPEMICTICTRLGIEVPKYGQGFINTLKDLDDMHN